MLDGLIINLENLEWNSRAKPLKVSLKEKTLKVGICY